MLYIIVCRFFFSYSELILLQSFLSIFIMLNMIDTPSKQKFSKRISFSYSSILAAYWKEMFIVYLYIATLLTNSESDLKYLKI